MSNEKKRKKLRVRYEMDKVEAESEIRQREEPGSYKMHYTESARQSLEKILTQSEEEREKEEEQNYRELIAKLNHLALQPPLILEFDHAPLLEWEHNGQKRYTEYSRAFLQLPDGEIIKVVTVVTPRWWSMLQRQSTDQDTISRIKKAVDQEVLRWCVNVPDDHLTVDVLPTAVRKWLSVHCPALADIPIKWLPESRRGELSVTWLARSCGYKTLEEMCQASRSKGND